MSTARVAPGVPTGGQFAASVRAEPGVDLPEDAIREMPAAEFAKKFPPSMYSASWEHLNELADEDVEEPADEDEWESMGAHFSWGGECGWTVDDLAQDFADGEEMRDPVEVIAGHVTEGHHRVVAALRVDATVRFRVLDMPEPVTLDTVTDEQIAAAVDFANVYCAAGGGARPGTCYAASWNIEEEFGWPIVEGRRGGIPHAWNEMPDGRIFDPTAAQFGDPGPTVTTSDDPCYEA